jgi:hypothetical protein
MPFVARRATRSYLQSLEATPERVFPLLCPVREREWAVGWSCEVVYSRSGVAELGCVFTTRRDNEPERIWVITAHDPALGVVEFCTVTPGLHACRIHIALEPAGAGKTRARVVYEYTALSEAGNAFVDAFTEDEYRAFMRAWEDELNHFLRTGERL